MHPKWILLVVAILLPFGVMIDVGPGLHWVGYTQPEAFIMLMMRLLFLSLIAERIIEFYVLLFRSKGNKLLQAQINRAQKAGADDLDAHTNNHLLYKDTTRARSAMVGFTIGAVMAIIGIRVFTGMFDLSEASIMQRVLFDVFEVFVMGAIIAGGSKGINKIVSAVEAFAQAGKDNVARVAKADE